MQLKRNFFFLILTNNTKCRQGYRAARSFTRCWWIYTLAQQLWKIVQKYLYNILQTSWHTITLPLYSTDMSTCAPEDVESSW